MCKGGWRKTCFASGGLSSESLKNHLYLRRIAMFSNNPSGQNQRFWPPPLTQGRLWVRPLPHCQRFFDRLRNAARKGGIFAPCERRARLSPQGRKNPPLRMPHFVGSGVLDAPCAVRRKYIPRAQARSGEFVKIHENKGSLTWNFPEFLFVTHRINHFLLQNFML